MVFLHCPEPRKFYDGSLDPGPLRASDLGSVDAAAAHNLPAGHRDLPRDPTGAAALFGDSVRYE